MFLRILFFSIVVPFLEFYVKLFVQGEKLYRQYRPGTKAEDSSADI